MTHYMIIRVILENDLLLQFVNWYKYALKCDIPLEPKATWCVPGYATILFKDKDTYNKDCNIRVRTAISSSREGKNHLFEKALQSVSK